MFCSNSPASTNVLSSLYLVGATLEVLDGPYPLQILDATSLPLTPPAPPPAEHCRAVDPKQHLSGDQNTLLGLW